MNRFLDTCVIIAYCFPTHAFNNKCLEIIQIKKMWVSDNVLIEWREKEYEVFNDHQTALLDHIQYIQSNYSGLIEEDKKNELLAYSPLELERFMEIFYNQDRLFPIDVDSLCEKLDNIALEVRYQSKMRYKELEQRWDLVLADAD